MHTDGKRYRNTHIYTHQTRIRDMTHEYTYIYVSYQSISNIYTCIMSIYMYVRSIYMYVMRWLM